MRLSDRQWSQLRFWSNMVVATLCLWIGMNTVLFIVELKELQGNCYDLIEPDVLCPIMCENKSIEFSGPVEASEGRVNVTLRPSEFDEYMECKIKSKRGFTPEDWLNCSRWFQPV